MMQLQPPLVLAQLPRPLGAEGRILFNSVYGVSPSGKIKRHEIVGAVDGEAVNIYDVNISHLYLLGFARTLIFVAGAISPTDHILFCTTTVLVSVPALFNPAEK